MECKSIQGSAIKIRRIHSPFHPPLRHFFCETREFSSSYCYHLEGNRDDCVIIIEFDLFDSISRDNLI